MDFQSLFDRNHLIGLVVSAVTILSLITISSSDILESIHLFTSSPFFISLLLLVFAVRAMTVLPLSLLIVFVGFEYSLPEAFFIAAIGSLCSALLPYLIGRHIRTPTGPIGFVSTRATDVVDEVGGFRGVLGARLSLLPSDIVSYGAGLARVPLRAYLLGTLVGWIPIVAILVFFGNSMQAVSAQGALLPIEFVVATSLATLLLIGGPLYRYHRRR